MPSPRSLTRWRIHQTVRKLYVVDRRTGAPISSSETRVSATAFWEQVNLMVSSALFFLAGRALPEALQRGGEARANGNRGVAVAAASPDGGSAAGGCCAAGEA